VWGGAADYVNPEDHDALLGAIDGLVAAAERRSERALAARTRALELTPARMVREYANIYGCAARRAAQRMGRCAS
jgi:hypothetical protein